MTSRLIVSVATALAVWSVLPAAPRAQVGESSPGVFTAPLSVFRDQIRPPIENLPLPHGFTKEQIALGDRVFHGEAAGGRCSICHGRDAKGTATGNDLTTGMYIWADGSVKGIKAVLNHNMSVAPGMDGDLKPTDVEAVAAYIWALGRQNR
jgi:hypothetical protein